jgi:hypothetical protein
MKRHELVELGAPQGELARPLGVKRPLVFLSN